MASRLLNDSKYGYECEHNELRLSLLKSATMPDPVADQGRHIMTYSLLPHIGDWRGEVPSSRLMISMTRLSCARQAAAAGGIIWNTWFRLTHRI